MWAELSKEIGTPDIVIAGAAGRTICVPIAMLEPRSDIGIELAISCWWPGRLMACGDPVGRGDGFAGGERRSTLGEEYSGLEEGTFVLEAGLTVRGAAIALLVLCGDWIGGGLKLIDAVLVSPDEPEAPWELSYVVVTSIKESTEE